MIETLYEQYKVDLPDSQVGDWEISHFTIKDPDWQTIRAMLDGRPIPPGDYTRLTYKNHVIMSDTPAEIRDCLPFLHYAKHGRILINGLGMGLVPQYLLKRYGQGCQTKGFTHKL